MQTRRGQLVFTDILSGFSELYLSLHVDLSHLVGVVLVLVKILCRQLSSKVAAACPQPPLLERTRESQSHKLYHKTTQRQPHDCPTDPTRCWTKKARDSESHSTRAVRQTAVKGFTRQLTSKNNSRTTDRCSSPFPRVQSYVKVSRSHTF